MAEQYVITTLMVLTVLMLFIITWAINRIIILRIRKNSSKTREISTIMQHTLDICGNDVVMLDLHRRYARNLYET